jgi:glutamine synthetase
MNTATTELPAGTHTVVMGVGDLNGIMRGKRIPASHWPSICENGVAVSLAMLALDMTCDIWDTPYTNFDNGYADFHIFPTGPAYAVPWEEGVAFCFGRAEGTDHKPVPIDPRNALIRVLDRASAMGYEVQIGAELEFYLLDPETLKPRDRGIQVYGLARAAELEHVLGPIRRYLNDVGIPIEQSNPEYAAGQVEVNIRYSEALTAADRVIAFRSLVKELASSQNYIATFMAKPFFEESGNGFHVHHSLWKDGKNAFADGGKLSALGMNYLAGMQGRMVEMSLAAATTPNAYRRRQPYTFCPINTAWSVDNRTVGLRVIQGRDSAVRVEKRDGTADCNPYYLIACEIAAGLDGIEQGLAPTAETPGNAYVSEDAAPIPTDLATAVELAKGSAFMTEVIGEDGLGILIQQGERELEFFANQVTPVEIERYLTNM